MEQEGILNKFNPHPFYYIEFYLSIIILLVLGFMFFWPLLFFAILIFVYVELSRRRETFYLLETGIAKEYKLLSTYRKFAEYDNLQNVEVRQSFLENIMGIGSIGFDTAGAGHMEIYFRGVKHPYRIENMVRSKMKKPSPL